MLSKSCPYLLPETVGEEVADAAAALSLSFTLPQYSTLTYCNCIFTKWSSIRSPVSFLSGLVSVSHLRVFDDDDVSSFLTLSVFFSFICFEFESARQCRAIIS